MVKNRLCDNVSEWGDAKQIGGHNETRLTAVLNQLPGAVGLFDTGGHTLLRRGSLSHLWDEMIPSRAPGASRRWRGFDAAGGPLPRADYPGELALRGETVSPGIDFLHTADDGSETWCRASAAPFRDNRGEIAGAVIVLQEIDKEKRAEQRLRDSEEYFRLALEAGNMGIWEWDAATRLIKADKAHQALFGLPAQEEPRPNEDYWARMDSEESKIGTQRAMNAIETGTDIQLELRVRPSEGVTRWIAVRGRPRDSGSGSIIGISYDITDRKHRQDRLLQSEARLKAAADLVNLGLYSWDPQTNEVDWDKAVKAMWGLPEDAPISYETWRDAVHPDDLERVESAIARCADPAGDGRYDIEYRIIGITDGIERWVATRGQAHFEGGKAVAFQGAALDVTSRKLTENLLEGRVETRTRELEESNAALIAEIEQGRQVAGRLDVIQAEFFHAARLSVAGQMAAVIAHELSQPLTATLNSVNAARRLLTSGDPGRDVALRELTEEAGNEIERASEIVRRLRFFIRRGSVDRLPEAVAPMVEEAVAFAAVGPNALGVKISQYFDPLVPIALVDRVQIQQVISNLVRNSLEAMKLQPRRELTVTTAACGDGYLELIVSDSGPGVGDEMKSSLFEPFMTTKPGGMGLGLSICKSIVEAHGGHIAYAPSLSGGGAFRFTLQTPAGEAAE
jgi:PAS domain S-box-containing protein